MPGKAPNPLTATTPSSCGAGGSMSATYPVANSYQARVNDSRTEEQGPVIGKIKSDMKCIFVVRTFILVRCIRLHTTFRPVSSPAVIRCWIVLGRTGVGGSRVPTRHDYHIYVVSLTGDSYGNGQTRTRVARSGVRHVIH